MKFVLKIPKNLLSVLLLPSLLTTEWIWVGLANFLDKIEMLLPQLDHQSRFSPAGGYWERIKMLWQPYEYELMSHILWLVSFLSFERLTVQFDAISVNIQHLNSRIRTTHVEFLPLWLSFSSILSQILD